MKAAPDNPLNGQFFIYDPLTGQFSDDLSPLDSAQAVLIPEHHHSLTHEKVVLEALKWIASTRDSCLLSHIQEGTTLSVPKDHFVRLPAPSHIHSGLVQWVDLVSCLGGIRGLSTRIVPGEGSIEFTVSYVISAHFGVTEMKGSGTSNWSIEIDREGEIGLDGCDFMWQMVKEGISKIECGEREVRFYHLPEHVKTEYYSIFMAHLQRMTSVGYELEFTRGPELRYGLFGDAATREIRGAKMSSQGGMVFALKPQSP